MAVRMEGAGEEEWEGGVMAVNVCSGSGGSRWRGMSNSGEERSSDVSWRRRGSIS